MSVEPQDQAEESKGPQPLPGSAKITDLLGKLQEAIQDQQRSTSAKIEHLKEMIEKQADFVRQMDKG